MSLLSPDFARSLAMAWVYSLTSFCGMNLIEAIRGRHERRLAILYTSAAVPPAAPLPYNLTCAGVKFYSCLHKPTSQGCGLKMRSQAWWVHHACHDPRRQLAANPCLINAILRRKVDVGPI